jgi:hypothetical protein
MGVFLALLALAFAAPLFPLLVAKLDRRVSALFTPRRRIIRQAAVAGGLGILPVGLLFTLAAYGDWIVLLLIGILGGLYGALAGAAIAWLHFVRHRDRTG